MLIGLATTAVKTIANARNTSYKIRVQTLLYTQLRPSYHNLTTNLLSQPYDKHATIKFSIKTRSEITTSQAVPQ